MRYLLLAGGLALALASSVQAQSGDPAQLLRALSPELQTELLKDFRGSPTAGSEPPALDVPELIEPLDIDELAPVDEATGLRPFGYDVFAGQPSTYAPATDIPVPANYVVGPGDTVRLQYFGKENAEHALQVTRDGRLQLPDFGPMDVAGMSYEAMAADLKQRIEGQKIGVKVSVTMGRLRSIRVYVMGEARRPGSYTVSALSTMTNALMVSGGVKTIGSLRNVQLKRQGKTVSQLDLYHVLLSGDTVDDVRLLPGDVIFIPPIGQTAAIDGAIRRPAIYELRGDRSLSGLISMAGGLRPDAWGDRVTIRRVGRSGQARLVETALNSRGLNTRLRDGDVVNVYPSISRIDGRITIKGHAERSGDFAWRKGLRLTHLIKSPNALKLRADLDFALIMRTSSDGVTLSPHYVWPRKAFAAPGGPDDPLLEPRDEIYFFPGYQQSAKVLAEEREFEATQRRDEDSSDEGSNEVTGADSAAESGSALIVAAKPDAAKQAESSRSETVEQIVGSLIAQASTGERAPIARINGAIRFPGRYPMNSAGTTVSALIRAAGGLEQEAYLMEAEISRYRVSQTPNGLAETITHESINLAAIAAGDPGADVALTPKDVLTVRFIPDARQIREVEIIGEVRFAGTYQVTKGESILDLIERGGGLTELAYPYGAAFTREELRQKEQTQAARLLRQLRADLAGLSLLQLQKNPDDVRGFLAAQGLLDQLETYEAVGRLVIDLPAMLDGRAKPLVLKNGDRLIIPPRPNEVTVVGEVQFPTSHLFSRKNSRKDYVQLSGGTTSRADRRRIFVVRADGSVSTRRGWLFGRSARMRPGDTVIVPLNPDPIRPLTLTTSITQVIYQLGLAAASFKAIGAL